MTLARLVEAGPGSDVDALSAFGSRVAPAARCNAVAVEAGRYDLTYPSPELLGRYLADDEHHVFAVEAPGRLLAYAVVQAGGRIRWLVVDDAIEVDDVLAAVRAIAEESVTRWGACFGRVSNTLLRHLLLRLPEVRSRRADPEVLEWD